ncbi:ABC1 kinase family protein [Streptomyces enissocaesilis]|uniref:AarF/UbiB family protein n=1 Tax=Streptomyces enissocaesilis TaxID=332589 RepID=A0ABN3XPG2_9ACTN
MGHGRRARQITKELSYLAQQELRRSIRRQLDDIDDETQQGTAERAQAVRQTLEGLGPFYIKVGQILSTRPDFVSPSMVGELQKLHDQVTVAPFADFEPVLKADLGIHWSSCFKEIDTDNPLGAASLAQVYRAVLSDGTLAAVKIQRPGVRNVVEADMALLRRLARFAGRRAPRFNAVVDIDAMLKVIFDAMRPELDFSLEAAHMRTALTLVADFQHITVPKVFSATSRVLVQSLAPGCSIRDADPAAFCLEERTGIGRELLAFMYRGYFTDRFFHADPHPGNVFVHPGQPAHLIDWGMVGRIDRPLSQSVLRVLLCLAQNDGTGVAKAWVEMGHATAWAQLADFRDDMAALVPQVVTASLEELDFGVTLGSVLTYSTRRGIKTSPMVSVLAKSFANIEGSIRHLSPELSIIDVFQEELRSIIFRLVAEHLSGPQAARSLLEALTVGSQVPQQLRSIITGVADRELSLDINQGPTQNGLHSGPGNTGRKALLAAGALLLWHRTRTR